MPFLQDIIHRIEEGAGPRYIRMALIVLAVLALLMIYNLRVTRNFGIQEAMDSAQLARNIAEGKGYTTSFVRPFSLYLVSERSRSNPQAAEPGKARDEARIKQAHPDISNPPVYPVVLAGVMKVLPFNPEIAKTQPFWSSNSRFWRYQPDFLITWFNQLLFILVVALTFIWARRLFDATVATGSTILLLGAEVLWSFSASGLSTMLLLLILMGIVWMLTLLHEEILEPKRGAKALYVIAIVLGLLTGLGGLTRYGFALLIIPVFLMVVLFAGPKRVPLAMLLIVAFTAVMLPWMIRNHSLSGALFGTAGFDLFKGASLYEGHQLERSLDPNVQFSLRAMRLKLLINSRLILEKEFFGFGGGWIMALFLVGLMVGFKNPLIRRMRYFAVGSLALLFVVQALGRTQLSEDSPGINSENLLILLLPLTVVFAVGIFSVLLDQIQLPAQQLRYGVWGIFGVLSCLPLVFALIPPRNVPVNYPPYYPPAIRQTCEMFRENELLMSDVPWAVAWYGNRQCVWLTLDALPDPDNPDDQENFFTINDLLKPVYGVYLTPRTMDMRFESEMIRGGNPSWGGLVLNTMLNKDSNNNPIVPRSFPLREVPPGYLPEQMLFTDWKRWNRPE